MKCDYEKLKNMKDVDIIFFSGSDHYGGTDNHGGLQMFKYFKKHINKKCLFINSTDSLYSNNKDIFDLSHLIGKEFALSKFINSKLIPADPRHLSKFVEQDKYCKILSKKIIEALPSHRMIVIFDNTDVMPDILSLVISHFSSKVLFVSMVNNNWTGFCSYPEEYNCKMFKTGSGCSTSCPAIAEMGMNNRYPEINFNSVRRFVENNQKSIFLNVGNSYVLKEANSSLIFSDIEKVVIPLKTVELERDNYEDLRRMRNSNKEWLVQEKLSLPNNPKIIMWSSYSMGNKRKGFLHFIAALKVLKNIVDRKTIDNLVLIISGLKDDDLLKELDKLKIHYWFTGLIKDRKEYTKILSGCDIYCSTTISDAGPRTTYESAACGTPIISYDSCNSVDFVNDSNGCLVKNKNSDEYGIAISKIISSTQEEQESYSKEIYYSYRQLMDDKKISKKWNNFLNKTLEQK